MDIKKIFQKYALTSRKGASLENAIKELVEELQELNAKERRHDLNGDELWVREAQIGSPRIWLYLLSKGFDLFGLIEQGLAKSV